MNTQEVFEQLKSSTLKSTRKEAIAAVFLTMPEKEISWLETQEKVHKEIEGGFILLMGRGLADDMLEMIECGYIKKGEEEKFSRTSLLENFCKKYSHVIS